MSSDCKPIDFAKPDAQFETWSDCSTETASRALYEQVGAKVVQLNARDKDAASGFFVNNGDEILTDGHAAAHSPVRITTADGKQYETRLEKLDEVHDLALLKVVGIEPDAKRAVNISDSVDPAVGSALTAIGHPLGRAHSVVAVGPYKDSGTLFEYGFGRHTRVIAMLRSFASSDDEEIATNAKAALEAPRMRFAAPIYPGNSGSVVVDTKGKFAGIVAEQIPGKPIGLAVPAAIVREFVKQPETKFDFEYIGQSGAPDEKLIIKRKNGNPTAPLV